MRLAEALHLRVDVRDDGIVLRIACWRRSTVDSWRRRARSALLARRRRFALDDQPRSSVRAYLDRLEVVLAVGAEEGVLELPGLSVSPIDKEARTWSPYDPSPSVGGRILWKSVQSALAEWPRRGPYLCHQRRSTGNRRTCSAAVDACQYGTSTRAAHADESALSQFIRARSIARCEATEVSTFQEASSLAFRA